MSMKYSSHAVTAAICMAALSIVVVAVLVTKRVAPGPSHDGWRDRLRETTRTQLASARVAAAKSSQDDPVESLRFLLEARNLVENARTISRLDNKQLSVIAGFDVSELDADVKAKLQVTARVVSDTMEQAPPRIENL
jgi:hypothetical protein